MDEQGAGAPAAPSGGADSPGPDNPQSAIRDPQSEAALAEDGRLYRADLRAEVARLAGCVGAAKEAALLAEALADQPAARWKELRDEYQARFDARFPPQPTAPPPGDPPAAPARADEFAVI